MWPEEQILGLEGKQTDRHSQTDTEKDSTHLTQKSFKCGGLRVEGLNQILAQFALGFPFLMTVFHSHLKNISRTQPGWKEMEKG